MEHSVIVVDDEGNIGRFDNLTLSFKKRLAASMVQPIRRSLDYQGIARRALVVDPLPQGALPIYDKEPTSLVHDTIIVDDEGNITTKESHQNRVFGGRVMMPTFEIAANPTIRITDVKRRRFNVIDRAVQKARAEMQAEVDNEIFKAIESINTKK